MRVTLEKFWFASDAETMALTLMIITHVIIRRQGLALCHRNIVFHDSDLSFRVDYTSKKKTWHFSGCRILSKIVENAWMSHVILAKHIQDEY